jgi:hypothetical protein
MSKTTNNQTAAGLLVIGLVAAAFHITGSHTRLPDVECQQQQPSAKEPS